MPKKSRKCLPGPRDPKKSPESPGTLQKHSPDTFRRLSGDFPDCPRDFLETFWGPGAGGPGRHFRDFFGISGPKGPGDLCKGLAGSQALGPQGIFAARHQDVSQGPLGSASSHPLPKNRLLQTALAAESQHHC